ncbi:hypothetical protein BH23GEM8_BH23GEM8_14860 [soil metagenome]
MDSERRLPAHCNRSSVLRVFVASCDQDLKRREQDGRGLALRHEGTKKEHRTWKPATSVGEPGRLTREVELSTTRGPTSRRAPSAFPLRRRGAGGKADAAKLTLKESCRDAGGGHRERYVRNQCGRRPGPADRDVLTDEEVGELVFTAGWEPGQEIRRAAGERLFGNRGERQPLKSGEHTNRVFIGERGCRRIPGYCIINAMDGHSGRPEHPGG